MTALSLATQQPILLQLQLQFVSSEYHAKLKHHLRQHKVTHTPREKTFICDKCDCRYTTKGSLTFHVKTKHSQMK